MRAHINIELVDAGAHPSRGQQQQPLALLYVGQNKHIKRETTACVGCRMEGIWILIARPVWRISTVDNVDYFKLVRSRGGEAGSQKRSRSSLLQIQGKQMEMRLSQLDSMCVLCVCMCVAKYSYLFPLSMRSEACPHIQSGFIGSFITRSHLMN